MTNLGHRVLYPLKHPQISNRASIYLIVHGKCKRTLIAAKYIQLFTSKFNSHCTLYILSYNISLSYAKERYKTALLCSNSLMYCKNANFAPYMFNND